MGTRCASFSGSIVDLRGNLGSVTLDPICIKGYFDHDALADPPDHLAPHTDPAPRRRLAEASAHGGRPAPRVGLDPSGVNRNHRALSVAGAGDRVVPWRGDAAACRPD